MSTTFCVYPKETYIPTFLEVLDLANLELSKYLHNISLNKNVCLSVELQTIVNHDVTPFKLTERMDWSNEKYAWFYISKIAGGTDCYSYKLTNLDKEFWTEELELKSYNHEIKEIIKSNLEIGRYWSFRKSAGQSGIITLSYGLLAASLAMLTDGFVFTDDGAWDYLKFPAKADDFLNWYFKPELTTNMDDKSFSLQCIEQIKAELQML